MKTSGFSSVLKESRPRHSFFLILALFMNMGLIAQGIPETRLMAVSRIRAEADEAIALGYYEIAAEELNNALKLIPGHAATLWQTAKYHRKTGSPVYLYQIFLEAALAGKELSPTEREEASLELAALYCRIKRPGDALRVLASLGPALQTNAELLYIRTRANLALGQIDAARRDAALAASRYPRDARVPLAWLAAPSTRSESNSAYIEALLKNIHVLKETDRLILVYLAPFAGSLPESRYMIREYLAMGGTRPLALWMALSYGLISETEAAERFFSSGEMLFQHDLRALASLIYTDEGIEAFTGIFNSFTGAIYEDLNMDGIPEAVAYYREGELISWELDYNQDQRPEIFVSFSESAPLSVYAWHSGSNLAVSYKPWPFVSSVNFTDTRELPLLFDSIDPFETDRTEESRTYTLPYGALRMNLLNLDNLPGYGKTPVLPAFNNNEFPTETLVASIAVSIDTRRAGEYEYTELLGSVPIITRWLGNNHTGGSLYYNGGIPDYEEIDMDGDGRAETRRFWSLDENGIPRIERIETDMDGDGVYEYRKRLIPPLIDTWDIDGDGLPDLGLETLDDGSLIRSFSTRRDGRLDTRIHLLAGIPVHAEREGRELAIIPDNGGIIFWLGHKPFDFGNNMPSAGMGSRSSMRYIVHELEGIWLAEVIN